MLLRHLALAVTDEQGSREFYERWFGFGVEEARRYDDGVLMLYGPGSVRKLREEFAAAGVEITEFWDEPDYVSVKVRDPDGYVVETSWEP
jgi:catechol 2,3-dioxygenase-like lactoylglutathione lyase family enzyme